MPRNTLDHTADTGLEASAESLARLIEDAELRAALRVKGLERARRFDWRETARATLGIYRSTTQEEG